MVRFWNWNAGGRGSQSFSKRIQVDWNLEERAWRVTGGTSKGSQSGMLLEETIWKHSIPPAGTWYFTCLMQVHLSEARVSSALDKLAHMETLVNDRLLPDGVSSTSTAESTSLVPSTSSTTHVRTKKQPRRTLNVSGPVKPYNPSLKNFWYPVAFSSDLKDDTMVKNWTFQAITKSELGITKRVLTWWAICAILRYQ